MTANFVSLVLDVVEVSRYVRGEREPTVPGLTAD